MSEPTIDEARLPHEIRRALDAAAVLVDALEPGLYVRPEPGHLVILDASGNELAGLPLYRLWQADYSRLWPLAEVTLERLPQHAADQLLAAMRDDQTTVVDLPSDDYVRVHIAGQPFIAVHRSNLVDGWPDEDDEG